MTISHSGAEYFVCRCLTILACLLTIWSCLPSSPPPDVVAETDLGAIARAELEDYIVALPEARRSPPTDVSTREWHTTMLEDLIIERALEAESLSAGLADTQDGQEYITGRRESYLIEIASSRMISERVRITDDDLRAFYDAHPEDFSHPAQIRVRNIYRRVARDAPLDVWDAARAEMEDLLGRIHSGARFGSLAREYSDSETASLDGLIGRLDRGKMVPEIEEVLWNLGEGEVSDVIRTPVGFQIFKVEKFLGEFKMSFEEARSRLWRRLTREATEAAEQDILQELIIESGATYRPEILDGSDSESSLFALGDESLSIAEFHERLRSIGFFAARDLPPRTQLDKAVLERLFLWHAERTGIADEPEIATTIQRLELESGIALVYRKHEQDLIESLDEQDLRTFHEDRRSRFQTPRLFHLRILTLDFPSDRSWHAVYEELHQIAEEIRSGDRDFSQTAMERSTDFSASQGGDVGAIRSKALSDWAGPQAQRDVIDLLPGQVSDPILIERFNTNRLTYERSGYMLVKLEEIEESRELSFDEARRSVVEKYLEHHREETKTQIRTGILDSVHATIHPERL